MTYIEREALINELNKLGWGETTVVDVVNEFSSADVAPVVRCWECKHSYDIPGGLCCSYGVCVDCVVTEDFFCECGKRKDGENNG